MHDQRYKVAISADGTKITHTSWGEGLPVAYVPMPYPMCGGLDDDFASPTAIRAVIMRALGEGRRAIVYDTRGVGLSQRGIHDGALDSHVLDLRAVLDAEEVGAAALVSRHHGVPIALRFAERFPERVAGLVLFDANITGRPALPSAPRGELTDYERFADYFGRNCERWYGSAEEAIRTFRGALSAPDYATLFRDKAATFDVGASISAVVCPCLVLRRHGNEVQRSDTEQLVARLPHVEHHTYAGQYADDGSTEAAVAAIAGPFLDRLLEEPRPTSGPPLSPSQVEAVLTPRELEVLRLVATGMSNLKIAKQLDIAQGTVNRHVSNILRKLGVANRTEATRWAVERGLV